MSADDSDIEVLDGRVAGRMRLGQLMEFHAFSSLALSQLSIC